MSGIAGQAYNDFPFNIEALLCNKKLLKEKRKQLIKDGKAIVARCRLHEEEILGMLSKEDIFDLDTSWYDDERHSAIIMKKLEGA